MLVILFVVVCCFGVSIQGSSCPVLYGAVDPLDISIEGVRLYLDLNDEELSEVPATLQDFGGNDDGTIDIINNGIVEGLFSIADLVTSFPPIPSSIQIIPMYIESSNKAFYYSFNSISLNTTVLGAYNDVSPNVGYVYPGQTQNFSINFCCKENGTVLLLGCLTISDEPFQQANVTHLTTSPFYAFYQCTVPATPEVCSNSLSLTTVKVQLCFTTNQSAALILSGQEGWGVIGNGISSMFCGITESGVTRFLLNEENSISIPIGADFPTLDFFFHRGSDWTSPTYYSLSLIPYNTTVLNQINSSIPLQGTFDTEELYFTLYMSCISNGATFVSTQLNTSGLINGYVVNNSNSFIFYKICMPFNITEIDEAKSINVPTLVLSTVLPTLFVIIIIIIILSLVLAYTIKKRKQIAMLEQLATNVSNSYNAYAFATVYNPFDCIEDENIEYNYAAIDVIDKLGEGFFGTVYKARAPGLSRGEHLPGEYVAVKTLKDNSNADSLRDFAKELKTCLQFDHPNVIRLLGVCTTSVEKCMIFEFMDLGSMDYCLRASNPDDEDYDPSGFHLSTKDLLPIVLQLAIALDYLASLNFIHRDIAARNCLLNTQLTAKIADFGLSRNLNAQNYYRIGGGKKSYLPIRWMPPEGVLYGKFTVKSDVWSFGILMWEVYTLGQLPYIGLSNHEVIDCIKEHKILNQPDACPPEIFDIIRSCWTRVPSQRPMMSEVVRQLTNINLIPTNT